MASTSVSHFIVSNHIFITTPLVNRNKRAYEAGFSHQMPELALRFDSSTANIIHCLEKGQEPENDLRPIMMSDIIVLLRIAGIVIAIAFACLTSEWIYRHVRSKLVRRLVSKFRVYARDLKLCVEDRVLFGHRPRYHRRTIRVHRIRALV